MDFLPPVVLKLSGDISELLTNLAEGDAAVGAFNRSTTGRFSAGGSAGGAAFGAGVNAGARPELDRFWRDVNGRLHDNVTGRFVSEGELAGRGFAAGMAKGATSGGGGSGLAGILSGGFMPALISAGVGAGAQLVSALAPAVGVLGLLPAAVVGAATALGTLKMAVSGVGAAMSAGMAGNAAAYAKALDALTPAAASATRALVGLKPQLDALKSTVQQNFFAGLAKDISTLGGQYLPILRTALGSVASGFNTMLHQIAATASSSGAVQAFAGAMNNVAAGLRNSLAFLPGLISGLAQVFKVGATFLPGLTAGFGALGNRFSELMTRFADSGAMQAFFTEAIAAAKLLGPLIRNVGSILDSLLAGFGAAGGQALGVLGELIAQIAAFFRTAQGGAALRDLFAALGAFANLAGQLISGLLPIAAALLGSLGQALMPIFAALGPVVATVSKLLGSLGGALGTVFAALGPALASVLNALAPIVDLLAGQLGFALQALAPIIAEIATVMGQVLSQALTDLLPLFEQLLPVFREMAAQYLPQLIPLIKAWGDALLAVLPILPPLVALLADILVPAIKVAGPVMGVFAKALVVVVQALGAVIGPIAGFIGWLLKGLDSAKTWSSIGDFFTNIWHKITGAFDAGLKWIKEFPGKVWAALQQLPDLLERAATTAFHRFFYAVGYGIGTIIKEIFTFPRQVWAIITDLWDRAGNLFSTGVDALIGFARGIPPTLGHLFTQAKDWAIGAVESLVNRSIEFFSSLGPRAWSALKGLLPAIKDAVSDAGTWLLNAGHDVIMGLINGVKDALAGAIRAVRSAMHDIIAGAKDAMGMHSPSQVFHDIGALTVAGFVGGINANSGAATSAVARMLSFGGGRAGGAGIGGLAAAGGPGGGGGAGYAPIIIQLGGQQMAAVHAALIPAAQQYKVRNGATGLA